MRGGRLGLPGKCALKGTIELWIEYVARWAKLLEVLCNSRSSYYRKHTHMPEESLKMLAMHHVRNCLRQISTPASHALLPRSALPSARWALRPRRPRKSSTPAASDLPWTAGGERHSRCNTP